MRTSHLVPIHRNLLSDPGQRAIGWDTLTITPPDHHGNTNLSVFHDRQNSMIMVYARKDHSADSLLNHFYLLYSTYGAYDILYTDPGSDVCSASVKELNAWFGVKHVLSLAARP
jgi:hypothetical protein